MQRTVGLPQPATGRTAYLDEIKCLAIFCVCYYHFDWAGDLSFSEPMNIAVAVRRAFFGVSSASVPLFFMVAGALISIHEINLKHHYTRVAVLSAQYIVWRVFTFFIIPIINGYPLSNFTRREILEGLFLFRLFPEADLSHLWFMPTFVLVLCVAPLFKRSLERNRRLVFAVLGGLYLLSFVPKGLQTLWHVFPNAQWLNIYDAHWLFSYAAVGASMLFYFLLGVVIGGNRDKFRRIPYPAVIAAFFAGIALLYAVWQVRSTLANDWDNGFAAFNTLPTLIIALSLFVFFAKLPDDGVSPSRFVNSLVSFVGRNTLGVYYMHWILGITVLPAIHKALGSPQGLLPGLLRTAVIVVGFALITAGIKKIPLLKWLLI